MTTVNDLKGSYLISGITLGFAEGRRKILRYALENACVYITSVNRDGPQPFEYLEYAKRNVAAGTAQGAIDCICNAKRAIHLTIEAFFRLFGLEKAYKGADFPTRLEIIRLLNAFPTRIINSLNKTRNLVEHEYKRIEIDRAADFVDITEMFLLLVHPYLKHTAIGAFVGIEQDERCLEWKIDLKAHQVLVYEIANQSRIQTSAGRIYYDISSKDEDKQLLQTINIEKANRDKWLTHLDLFVYLTKRNASQLPEPDDRGGTMYLSKTESVLL